MTMRRAKRSRGGFTLLEVMVAVAILGLGLTVILTAQTGLFSSAKRAATMSRAIGLARCKMSEIEEHLLRLGYQLTEEDDEGPCCQDDESMELRCKWSVSPITLPELGGGADAGTTTSGLDSLAGLDTIGKTKDQLSKGETGEAVAGLTGMLSGGMSGGLGAGGPSLGAGAIAPLAMSLVYPSLKAMLESSIRKITVRVVWKEGPFERDLTVTQYVTNPQQGGFLNVDDTQGAGGAPGTGATTTTPATTTTSPSTVR
jgi:general secretion pathway protein I